MRKLKFLGQMLVVATLFFSCKSHTPMDLSKENLIPKPTKVVATGSSFEITAQTAINVSNDEAGKIGSYLSQFLKPSTGFDLKVVTSNDVSKAKGINLVIDSSQSALGDEGYVLEITPKRVVLTGCKAAGVFRGVQTLRQLLPARIEKRNVQTGPWLMASGKIEDSPKYGYRGAMLDVCRHFFSVEDVKRYIDMIAAYKMNTLHLHLTDDQGWRIEIKSWPKLTEIGGATQVGGGKGGFYTQEQYKEIVRYAQEQYITVIPEIDMPGHTNAALCSYAELNANNKVTKPYTGTDVGFSSLAIGKDVTYRFVEDVIRELAAITPGEYIHIGGDESHATKKDDYIKFINWVQDVVLKYNKKMIGWADVSAGKLKESSVAQFWQKEPDTALKAVEQGSKVIMSPAAYAYMDMQYDSICPLGLHWCGYVEVDKAYDWDLETNVMGIGRDDIVGIEAALWTETIETMDDLEYMVFPRLLGYAEIGWYTGDDKSWDEYKARLAKQHKRFEAMDLNYYQSKLVPWDVTAENKVVQK